MHQAPIFAMVFPFVVWGLIGIPLAFGNAFLARRLGKSAALWAILSIVPFVNLVFFYYVAYRIVFAVLDRLTVVTDDLRRLTPAR